MRCVQWRGWGCNTAKRGCEKVPVELVLMFFGVPGNLACLPQNLRITDVVMIPSTGGRFVLEEAAGGMCSGQVRCAMPHGGARELCSLACPHEPDLKAVGQS